MNAMPMRNHRKIPSIKNLKEKNCIKSCEKRRRETSTRREGIKQNGVRGGGNIDK